MNASQEAFEAAGLTNEAVKAFVREWAGHTGAAAVEVVDANDDARLAQEALAAGEIHPVKGGRFYSRSFWKDTARTEERTFVATSNPQDEGVFNNWHPADEIKPKLRALMKDALRGKTMYVIPYSMSPAGSPLARWAAGVQLTDSRPVVLHMVRMARTGVELINQIEPADSFVRGVHVTGDLDELGQGTEDDQRHFVTVADERLILHYGSSYGGNALLGKIAHGLRQASYDGFKGGFLAEQFMLIGIRDKETGRTSYVAGGFPSASGKTNLAMMIPPPSLAQRYEVQFLGDDIAWMWRNPEDGRLYGINPEFGVFGVARDTNQATNPNAMASIGDGSGAIFTNTAYNPSRQEVWWEGLTPEKPADLDGWLDWKGEPIADRPPERQRSDEPGDEWSHPNSRFTTNLKNVPNVSPSFDEPGGVPIDAIIFGGRVREREPLVRALRGLGEAVYDGLTLGAEATAAAEGKAGVIRYDPMSMRPFMSYAEGAYARHWLDVIGEVAAKPVFAHVNWFQRDADDRYLWPGYGDNLRVLLWLLDLKAGRLRGHETPIGILPRREELDQTGLDINPLDLSRLLSYDPDLWREEMTRREEYLQQFTGLPQSIWDAHNNLAQALGNAAK